MKPSRRTANCVGRADGRVGVAGLVVRDRAAETRTFCSKPEASGTRTPEDKHVTSKTRWVDSVKQTAIPQAATVLGDGAPRVTRRPACRRGKAGQEAGRVALARGYGNGPPPPVPGGKLGAAHWLEGKDKAETGPGDAEWAASQVARSLHRRPRRPRPEGLTPADLSLRAPHRSEPKTQNGPQVHAEYRHVSSSKCRARASAGPATRAWFRGRCLSSASPTLSAA